VNFRTEVFGPSTRTCVVTVSAAIFNPLSKTPKGYK
jgi:hypothetical protein